MKTRVVNISSFGSFDSLKQAVRRGQAVYIGRAMHSHRLPQSPFANPFLLGKEGNRKEVTAKYRAWLLQQPKLVGMLGELKGKDLVCWCHPRPCHGDVLVELIERITLARNSRPHIPRESSGSLL
jgi:hypothetical protein